MTKHPLVNASLAFIYISLVASVMFYGSQMAKPNNSVLAPIALISLFTLSAAVMGYIFLYQPIQLYFNNKKSAAVTLFFQTVLIFAAITAISLILLFA